MVRLDWFCFSQMVTAQASNANSRPQISPMILQDLIKHFLACLQDLIKHFKAILLEDGI